MRSVLFGDTHPPPSLGRLSIPPSGGFRASAPSRTSPHCHIVSFGRLPASPAEAPPAKGRRPPPPRSPSAPAKSARYKPRPRASPRHERSCHGSRRRKQLRGQTTIDGGHACARGVLTEGGGGTASKGGVVVAPRWRQKRRRSASSAGVDPPHRLQSTPSLPTQPRARPCPPEHSRLCPVCRAPLRTRASPNETARSRWRNLRLSTTTPLAFLPPSGEPIPSKGPRVLPLQKKKRTAQAGCQPVIDR